MQPVTTQGPQDEDLENHRQSTEEELCSFAQSAAASLATPTFARLLGCLSHAAALLLHGLSARSRLQYDPVSKEYQAFCLQHFGPNQLALSSSDLHLIKWVAELGHSGQSYHAIHHCLAALSSWHIDLGLDSSTFSHPRTQRALKGFKRLYGVTQHGQKLPITLPILRDLLDALRVSPVLSSSDRITFTVAFTLAYACLLHCAEFTWSHLGDPVLQLGSITWSATYATLCLARSKTDPFGKGVDLIVPKVGGLACPMALLTICGSHPLQAPLFALDDGAAPSPAIGLQLLSPSAKPDLAAQPVCPRTLVVREPLEPMSTLTLIPQS
ncbi:uncharacterized protein UHOD_11221 [Ustilago sp. UG-2017b]|nr:uncharacterized protein UHOD_11221 [Ustilago sp. UG-2017b]